MGREVSRLLDEEHQATLALLEAVERAVPALAGGGANPELASMLRKLHVHITEHVPRHFGFEEDVLFPPLTEAGEGDLCALLKEEHDAIYAVIAELAPVTARGGALLPEDMPLLRRASSELAERLRSHIDKETMALLPACSDALDDQADRTLALDYAAS